jgi:hypothetical protein
MIVASYVRIISDNQKRVKGNCFSHQQMARVTKRIFYDSLASCINWREGIWSFSKNVEPAFSLKRMPIHH